MWLHWGGVHGCMGGMRGFIRGACVVLFWGVCVVLFGGGHAWFYLGGVCGFIWGHAWFYSRGACVVLFLGGVCDLFRGGMRGFFSFFRYNEIQSMSRRYASYWNAFLFCYSVILSTGVGSTGPTRGGLAGKGGCPGPYPGGMLRGL